VRAAATRKRETGYSLALKAYSEALHPGMTRKDIEDYLRSRKMQFSWVFTVFGGRHERQYANLVKIGEEAAWPCGETYVYVAFEFSPAVDVGHSDSMCFRESRSFVRDAYIFRPSIGCL
jgi:hypothetical protein